ncbi:MAG: ATP synthase subunit I [Myxococcales bacterium]|nr:ATP synthase subunit I [Myxococcales bacterium]MCB9545071.1 ATP synthase subunit I [Myxococcales bacterium]
MGHERLLNWVTVCAAILGVVAALGTLPLGDAVLSYSVGIGAGIAVLNLLALRRVVRRMVAGGATGRATGVFVLKFLLVIVGLWALFKFVPLHALGLMGGLSVVIVAVLLGTLFGPAPDAGQGEVNAKGGDGAVSGVSDG